MPRYRRVWVPGGTYFFTVNLLERRRTLLVDRIDDLRAAFRAAHAARPIAIEAIVILPDHLHCLWRLPDGDADNATRWRHIKSTFSRYIPKEERCSLRREHKAERGIWQRRFWEHLIADEDDLQRHVDYIHINPVKHGYAARARDWPYSSIHRLVRRGWVPSDWAADKDDGFDAGER
jgi:putative transposase